MPIPKPDRNESRGAFMSRCVRFLMDEGQENERALAICYDAYRDKNKLKQLHNYFVWKTIDSKRRSFEPYAEKAFTRATNKQLKQYLDEVKRTGSIDFELTGVVTDEPIASAYDDVYTTIMPVFAIETFEKLQKSQKKAKKNWREIVRRWMRESDTTSKIVNVSNTTRKRIRKQVVTALKNGTPIPEFAKTLRGDYGFSTKRGMLIGRTEMISASNAGSLIGAQESGVPTNKVWLSTPDDRTRGLKGEIFDHWSMDGTRANLNGEFDVSGELMQYPGDSRTASPGNTINCRCTLVYEPVIPEGIYDTDIDFDVAVGFASLLDDDNL